jgi:hypothetical protein
LSRVSGLTETQLKAACSDSSTTLPSELEGRTPEER